MFQHLAGYESIRLWFLTIDYIDIEKPPRILWIKYTGTVVYRIDLVNILEYRYRIDLVNILQYRYQ